MTLRGVDDVDALLSKIAPRQAQNIMRATVHEMAGGVRKDAQAGMPVDDGDMKRATKAKREQVRYGRIRSTVRVAKKAFYWRFLEYGDGPDKVEHAFFLRAVERLRAEMMSRYLVAFGKKWEAALARHRKKFGG